VNKASELREQTSEELRAMERDLSHELWKSRFDNYTNQLDDTSKIKKLRKRIARIKTILTERELESSDNG
jgi:large subunit ribosomal protein L29